MTRGEAWFSHATTALVSVTGIVYGWMRYFAKPADEFALVNHPWQGDVQALHILFAPLIVFACGLVWRDHVWGRFRSGYPGRRKGGLTLMAIFFPMVASGYLLQTTTNESLMNVWIGVHVSTSVLWIVVYLAHQLTPRCESGDAR